MITKDKIENILSDYKIKSEVSHFPEYQKEKIYRFFVNDNQDVCFRICPDDSIQLQINGHWITSQSELDTFRNDLDTLKEIINILVNNGYVITMGDK